MIFRPDKIYVGCDVDVEAYLEELRERDPELEKSWLFGDWSDTNHVFAYYDPDKQHLNSPEAYEDYDDTP